MSTITGNINFLEPGCELDHYRIEALVATSGMATIFRAIDLHTGLQVALKVPHFEVESDPVFFDRFHREEEIGRELDHPGVMKVFTDGDRSRLYLVMEWIEGRLLREILNGRKKLPPERAVRIVLRICDALDYVHGRGVVHRDLKPENLMIDDEDNIKLIDFGIAAKAGARRLTFGNFSKKTGTPDYVSPEQINGKRGDARSDVYSLGIMLYEMLTGGLPFPGADPFVFLNSKLLNHPVPPREVDPGITPQLQEIIYRALERDPKHRYASVREFAWDLEHQDQVAEIDRTELHDWKQQRKLGTRAAWLYAMIGLIPAFIIALLLLAARHG